MEVGDLVKLVGVPWYQDYQEKERRGECGDTIGVVIRIERDLYKRPRIGERIDRVGVRWLNNDETSEPASALEIIE
jgi:hypothetical protein